MFFQSSFKSCNWLAEFNAYYNYLNFSKYFQILLGARAKIWEIDQNCKQYSIYHRLGCDAIKWGIISSTWLWCYWMRNYNYFWKREIKKKLLTVFIYYLIFIFPKSPSFNSKKNIINKSLSFNPRGVSGKRY